MMFPEEEIKYEKILHTIWAEQLLSSTVFTTTCAKDVKVISPGFLNHSDGPDFMNAVIQIDSIIHYGAVEIHLTSSDWRAHKHHIDSNYNQVVLHVVADSGSTSTVRTSAGDSIPTVNIRPYLPNQVNELIRALSGSDLPCTGIMQYISEQAFVAQLEKAQQEYLDKKVQDFYSFFDPSKGLEAAWKEALMLAIADGLGIPHNRSAMVKAARIWLAAQDSESDFKNGEDFIRSVFEKHSINFSRKGVRPMHRPEQRLPQLHRLMLAIHKSELPTFLDADIRQIWNSLLESAGIAKSGFANILYGTVFLPAHLGLSQLVFSSALRQKVFLEWQQLEVHIPDQIRKKFAAFPKPLYANTRKNLGAVHQYHAYCKEKRCMECEVLNKAILS